MSRSERRLLGILIATLIFLGGLQFWPDRSWTTDGTSTAELQALKQQLVDQRLVQQRVAKRVQTRIEKCLPTDTAESTLAVQSWLMKLGRQLQLSSIQVTPLASEPLSGDLQLLPVTVAADATEQQTLAFLHAVRATGLEHRIRQWSLETGVGDIPRLNVQLEFLLHTLATQPDWSASEASTVLPADWEDVASRLALMRQPSVDATVPDIEPTGPPERTRARSQYKLVGIIVTPAGREAWFFDSTTQRSSKRRLGDTLGTGAASATLREIQDGSVRLEYAAGMTWLKLGQIAAIDAPRSLAPGSAE